MNKTYLGAYWVSRQLTFRGYISAVQQFLAELQRVHSVFKQLYEVGDKPNDMVAIDEDLGNLEQIALERAYDRESKKYSATNPDGSPTLGAISATGYYLQFDNNKNNPKERVTVSIGAGMENPRLTNAIIIKFPEVGYPEFQDPAFVTRLLAIVVEYWQPQQAIVSSGSFRDLTYDEKTGFFIGWLTYLSNPSICQALPADISCEPFGSRGALITVSPHMSSAENPGDVTTAITIASTLREKGLMTYEAVA